MKMELWTYALRCVVTQWNNTPRKDLQYKTPDEKFNRIKRQKLIVNVRSHFKHFHPFGCPVYILDNNLQSGKSLPKWKPRARVGIYLGQSREHASNVSYVLNPMTDHISPQYHVIYDDDFATVSAQTDMQKVKIWEGLNKTQPKLGLVNQLPNQNKFNFEEQDPMLNVIDGIMKLPRVLLTQSLMAYILTILGQKETKRVHKCQTLNQGKEKIVI